MVADHHRCLLCTQLEGRFAQDKWGEAGDASRLPPVEHRRTRVVILIKGTRSSSTFVPSNCPDDGRQRASPRASGHPAGRGARRAWNKAALYVHVNVCMYMNTRDSSDMRRCLLSTGCRTCTGPAVACSATGFFSATFNCSLSAVNFTQVTTSQLSNSQLYNFATSTSQVHNSPTSQPPTSQPPTHNSATSRNLLLHTHYDILLFLRLGQGR
jgi:hypothetical protein